MDACRLGNWGNCIHTKSVTTKKNVKKRTWKIRGESLAIQMVFVDASYTLSSALRRKSKEIELNDPISVSMT